MSEQDDKVERKGFNDFALRKDYAHTVPKVERGEIGVPPQQREGYKGRKTTTIQLKKQR